MVPPHRRDEFALIDAFTRPFGVPASPFGPGDDAAVLDVPKGHRLVVTTDALVEDVHFTRATFRFEDVGHKALAVNLSDVAAMGASPLSFLCALSLPDDVEDAQLVAVARGMAALARKAGITLVGGNVTRGPKLSVTITALGKIPSSARPLCRDGARPGDDVYVSGALGDAAAGLAQPRPRDRQRRPAPEVRLGPALLGLATACIDVSDGLAQDLGHLAAASRVALELTAKDLPIGTHAKAAATSGPQALNWALTGGEDYVLAFTAPRRSARRLAAIAANLRRRITRIGSVVSGRGLWLDGRPLESTGFRHR